MKRRNHATLLALAAGVVAASMILTPGAEVVRLFGWEVPPLCMFSNIFGVECFGCGLTRSFTYMGHLQPAEAFARHMLGPVLFVLVASQVPLRAVYLWRAHRRIGAMRSRG